MRSSQLNCGQLSQLEEDVKTRLFQKQGLVRLRIDSS